MHHQSRTFTELSIRIATYVSQSATDYCPYIIKLEFFLYSAMHQVLICEVFFYFHAPSVLLDQKIHENKPFAKYVP
jgi:hypothetical protein